MSADDELDDRTAARLAAIRRAETTDDAPAPPRKPARDDETDRQWW